MLYPLKFHPILKKKIWGGERLAYKSKEHDESIGESWEISAVEDNISVVSNGILADNDLQELIEVYMGDLVGDHIYEKFGVEFPLLIKYIDANDDLSIRRQKNVIMLTVKPKCGISLMRIKMPLLCWDSTMKLTRRPIFKHYTKTNLWIY